MSSSIGGYSSPVDLGLGQTPQTTDPILFNEFTEVYNAIHILNQYLDNLRLVAEGGSGAGTAPSDSMPFNRFYTGTALVNISVGQPVSPSPTANGMLLGALASSLAISTPNSNFCGIALTSAVAGTTFRVGIGPAIIQFPGLLSGQLLWAYSSRATNGNVFGDSGLYTGNPGPKTTGAGTAYPMPVATCPVNGYALFGQFLLGS
jgi:hypothetical protein